MKITDIKAQTRGKDYEELRKLYCEVNNSNKYTEQEKSNYIWFIRKQMSREQMRKNEFSILKRNLGVK